MRHTLLVPFRGTPLVAGATTFPPAPLGALWMLGISGNLSLWQLQRENHTIGLRPWEMHPFCRLRRRLSTGKRLTRFSGRCAPLRIVFACHPGGGDFSGAMPCDTYEAEWEAESKLPSPGEVPPQAGIGVHFHRAAGAVCLFSIARKGGFMVLLAHQYTSPLPRFYQNWRRRRPHSFTIYNSPFTISTWAPTTTL